MQGIENKVKSLTMSMKKALLSLKSGHYDLLDERLYAALCCPPTNNVNLISFSDCLWISS